MRSSPSLYSVFIILAICVLLSAVSSGCKSSGGGGEPPIVDPPIVEPPIVEPPIVEPPIVEPPIVVIPPPLAAAVSGLWSDPATWGGVKPADYQEVTIPPGIEVALDENSPALGALMVEGTLVFAEKDIELKAGKIYVMGRMTVGTAISPFMHRAIITLGGNPGDPAHGNDFMVMRGTLDLHGEPRGQGWTRLAQTATAGASQLVLQQSMAWRPGDRIVIASTDFDMNQAEEMTVSAVAGNVVTLSAPLLYTHWGANEFGVEERAEVGLLTRNVKVQGHEGSIADGQGGHLMAMRGSTMRITGAEFTRMGLRGVLARYPVHFHMMGEALGSYIKDSSIHHNFNRCITIHGSHNTVVSGNVAYDTLGHCYFFEDGIETGNLLENNLGLVTRTPAPADQILISDRFPATFWISNPDNILRGNAAAGSEAIGFWYDLPLHPTGLSATDTIFPRYVPLREFSANTTHSNQDGLFVDGPKGLEVKLYLPRSGGSASGTPVVGQFIGLTGYKNRTRAVWMRNDNCVIQSARLADNAVGVTFASYETFLRDSIIVGETANKGNPKPGDPTGLDGRSLPMTDDPLFPIRGYEFYDGRVAVENTSFINFQPNAQRQASALGDFRFNPYSPMPLNYSMGLTFTNANAVYFDPMGRLEDGHRSMVFLDQDGTVTGLAGNYVVVNNPFLYDASCTHKPEWNAWICPASMAYANLDMRIKDVEPGIIAPMKITRQDNPALPEPPVQTLDGYPSSPATQFFASVAARRNYSIEFGGASPKKIGIWYGFCQPGEWVQVSLPYPYNPFTVGGFSQVDSPIALSASLTNAYYHDGTTLHLKMMTCSSYADIDSP